MDSISMPIAVLTRNGVAAVLYYANQEEANHDKVSVVYFNANNGERMEEWNTAFNEVWGIAKAWIEDRKLCMWRH